MDANADNLFYSNTLSSFGLELMPQGARRQYRQVIVEQNDVGKDRSPFLAERGRF